MQPPAAPCRFEEFWAAYPNKKGKQEAEKTWRRKKLDDRCDELIAHVALMGANDDGWLRGYVPMGSTYLNQARWEDVPREAARAGPSPAQSSPPSRPDASLRTGGGVIAQYELERARQTGRWMRDAHKDRNAVPLYAMGEDGLALRRAWLAGYDERDEQISRNRG